MANFLRVILVLLLGCACAPAQAAVFNLADEGEAYSECQAAKATGMARTSTPAANQEPRVFWKVNNDCSRSTSSFRCSIEYRTAAGGSAIIRACLADTENYDQFTWPAGVGCTSRNASMGQAERIYVGAKPPTCVSGCALDHGGTISTRIAAGGWVTNTSNTQYSGEVCDETAAEEVTVPEGEEPSPTSPDTEEKCTQAGTQTACIKPNGQYCATASATGNTFCWTPQQTGEQSTAQELQRRTPGQTRPTTPPTTPPPEGATWNPQNSHSATSPQNGDTTIINYTVNPVVDEGHNGTPPQDGGDGDGDDEEGDPGTVSGGGDCAAPPACTGLGENAAIQCAQVQQTWMARCGASLENGLACSSDAAPLVCTNMSPMECQLAAIARQQSCAAQEVADVFGPCEGDECDVGEGDDLELSDVWNADGDTDGDGQADDPIELDDSGWLGSRSCPTLPSFSVFGREVSFSSVQSDICGFFSVGGVIVLLLAAFQCVRILGET